MGPLVPAVQTWDYSTADGFQKLDGFIFACALLLLAHLSLVAGTRHQTQITHL